MKLWPVAVFALLLGGCRTAPPSSQSATFTGRTAGQDSFTVRYPRSWHRLGHAGDVLDIVNFPPERWTPGFVLPQKGAMITVVPAPEGIPSIENWIAKVSAQFRLLARSEIRIANSRPGACARVVETQWNVRQDGAAATLMTAYYCSASSALYRVELTNWRGNPEQSRLQAVALGVARSLESSGSSSP